MFKSWSLHINQRGNSPHLCRGHSLCAWASPSSAPSDCAHLRCQLWFQEGGHRSEPGVKEFNKTTQPTSKTSSVESQSSRAVIQPGFLTYRVVNCWVPTCLGESLFLNGRTENPGLGRTGSCLCQLKVSHSVRTVGPQPSSKRTKHASIQDQIRTLWLNNGNIFFQQESGKDTQTGLCLKRGWTLLHPTLCGCPSSTSSRPTVCA